MASIPPRSRLRSSCSSRQDRSTLETLLHMGFPKERAEKAIAATGNKGTQLASEWLLSHVNDPDLDKMEPREYIMYLCPVGELLNRLMEFWDRSSQQCGWNSAHIYSPHITLCSFFKIPHNKVNVLSPVMDAVAEECAKWPCVGPLGLDLFTQSKNFIGYFVKSPHHQYIESLMIRVQQEFTKAGIEMKPQMKQLHMTLAFQYGPEHHDLLMKLAQELQNSQCSASWEVRVYSRDAALKTAEVRKIIKHYKPAQADELELVEGDYVYMDPEEHEHSPDGWFKGTSWRSGVSAFFPGNFTIKYSQMAVWTMHRSVPVPSLSCHTGAENGLGSGENIEVLSKGDYDNVWSPSHKQGGDFLYAQVNKPKKTPMVEPRKMFVIRHAERCDFAFFRTWFDKSFDSEGRYIRFNLNCPKSLIPRSSYRDFNKDCPLTVIGAEEARITGEALRESGESITYIYCSPALRCVETATQVMKAYGSHSKICIEPSLFEWCGWYKPNMPTFMTPEELSKCGFPVNTAYAPYVKFENIKVYESVEEYYVRTYNFTQHVLRKHRSDGGNLLMVGHSGTLDACTRQLRGKPPRNAEEFRLIVRGCPYCCICMAVEDTSGKWNICEPPIPQLTHSANKEYSWESMLTI